MPTQSEPLLIGSIAIGVAAISAISLHRQKKALVDLKRVALEQFRSVRIDAPDPRYSFNGAAAAIVRTEETGGLKGLLSSKRNYVLAIYARNESGEYFMFRSTPTEPYIKHVSQSVARQVLGAQYKAPLESAA